MRAISIGLLAAAVLITAGTALAQTQSNQVIDVHENGAYAAVDVFLTTDFGYADVLVEASRTPGTTPGSTVTNLFYLVDENVFTPGAPYPTYVSTFGGGQIPNTALQGDSTAHMSLSVDTSQIAGFTATTCTETILPFTYSCAPGSLGLVQFDWQQLNTYQQHVAGTTKTNYGDYTTVQNYNLDQAQASATGNIVGLQLTNVSGGIGTNHDGEVLVFHNPPQQ